MSHDVFVSYSHADIKKVSGILDWLYGNGLAKERVFFDQASIHGAEQFTRVIANAIDDCKVFVFFISDESAKAKWVQNEVYRAIDQDKIILPIFLEDTTLPKELEFILGARQQLYFHRGNRTDMLKAILHSLTLHGVIDQTEPTTQNKPEVEAAPITKKVGNKSTVVIATAVLLCLSIGIFYMSTRDDGRINDLVNQQGSVVQENVLTSTDTVNQGTGDGKDQDSATEKKDASQTETESSESGNTSGNMNNGGMAVLRDGWIYYVNYLRVYRIKPDGSQLSKLGEAALDQINVAGDWIYGINWGDNGNLYRMKIDGTAATKLSDDQTDYLIVSGYWVYYINRGDGYKLYKIKTDGTEKVKLSEDYTSCINVVGDWIYYVNESYNHALYRIKIDGSERIRVYDDSMAWLNVVDDWIYYGNFSDEGNLYKMKTDGSQRTKLDQDKLGTVNVVGDWIYYINASDGNKIYKIKTDGTEKTKLNEDDSFSINVTGDWIYYSNVGNQYDLYKIKTDGTGRAEVP